MPKWTDKVGPEDFRAIAEKALPVIGRMLEDTAVALCPVDTTRLRGSITFATVKSRSQPSEKAGPGDGVDRPSDSYTLYVGTGVEYAPYVEYGTRFSAAQPYLRPAMDYGRKDAQKILERVIRRHLRGQ